MLGLLGRKCGMTRVFDEHGASVGVTVVHFEPNVIAQLKNLDKDGYNAVQIAAGEKKRSRVNKPSAGHFEKAGVAAAKSLKEFRVSSEELANFELGQAMDFSIFEEGQYVDVTGTSKGCGFAGVIKRHNFKMQDATHGNSLAHRAPGSIGQNQSPGKVFKGKKMAGQMGNVRCTVQSLQIVRIDQEQGLLLIKGGVPGKPGSELMVRPAVKKSGGKS